jgi:phosphate transport system protein
MAEQSKHIISSFDAALYGLKNDVLLMSSLTDRMFQAAVEGLLNRDSDLCNQVVADDDEIDLLEKKRSIWTASICWYAFSRWHRI